MKKTIMKVVALLLAVVLMLPSSLVFAATANQHVVYAGESKTDGSVTISKTLSETGIENYLDLALTVKTEKTVEELYGSTAIVLVLDASNTMTENVTGKTTSRLEASKGAVSSFISDYYNSGDNIDRYMGIVYFNTDAVVEAPLADYSNNVAELNGPDGALASIEEYITTSFGTRASDGKNAYMDSHERFTNIEGGLLLAEAMLHTFDAEHKYIILATDGYPTTYAYRGDQHDHGNETGGAWQYNPEHIDDYINLKNKQNIEKGDRINGYCPYMNCTKSTGGGHANDKCTHSPVKGDATKWKPGEPGYFYNGYVGGNSDYYCTGECNTSSKNGTYDSNGVSHVHNVQSDKIIECTHGTSYSDWGAWAAENTAEMIKNHGVNIFTVGIDIGGQYLESFDDTGIYRSGLGYFEKDRNNINNSSFSVLDFDTEGPSGNIPKIGVTSENYEGWLGGVIDDNRGIGGSKTEGTGADFYTSDVEGDFNSIFETVMNNISLVTKAESRAKWVISDPIPEPYDFLGFINDGNSLVKADYNGATVIAHESSEEISWDLFDAEAVEKTEGGKTYYYYTLKYRIKIDNEVQGYKSEVKPTNGEAKLHWEEWNPTDKKWDEKETKFPIPTAKGYLGSLEFTKVDSADNTKTVPGVSFKLSHNSNCSVCANAIAAGNISGNVAISDMTATSGSDGKVSFTKIPSGHEYTLTEATPANGYQKYDVKHNVTVSYGETFVDGKPANVFAELENVKIQPSEDNIVFSVKKTADESTPADKEFEFVLKEGNTEIDRIAVKKGQTASFDKIVYSEWSDIGYHTYTVTEVIPEGATTEGYTDDYAYDKTVYTAEVNVEVNDEGNRYVASVVSFKGPDGDVSSAANFTNDYLDPASVEFKVKKTVDNSEKTGTFKFELRENGTVIKTIEITGNGSDTFGVIDFDSLDELGIHTYTISEVVPADAVNGNTDEIAYDRTVYTKIVNVTTDGTKYIVSEEDGTEIENGKTFEYDFKNEYLDPAEVVLEVSKTIENEISDDMKFSFVITDKDGNILKDEDGNDYVVIVDKNNPKASFKPLVYNELKDILDEDGEVITHIYKIREVIPTDAVDGNTDEIAYDTEVYTVTVEAGINAERTAYYANILDFKDSSDNDVNIAAFENKFLDPAEVLFTVDKKRDEKAPDDDEFEFVLREKIDGDLVDIQTITVTGSENAFFDPIVYNKISQLGDHTYVVCEIIPEGGMDTEYVYSDAVYERTINVAIDSNRTFYVVTDKNGEPYDGETFEFYNEYLDPTEVQFTAKKTLEGTRKIPDGIFSFVLMNDEGKVLETVENIGNTVTFGKIVYKEPGTHKYTIREIRGDDTSILYDKAVYDVTVDVIYKTDEDGRKIGYETEITYKENKKEAEGIVFENILREPAEVVLKAKKTVNGVKPGDLSYTFNLRDSEGNIVDTAKNNEDGEIVFDTLSFNKEGTYYYTISEKPFYSEEMNYDRTVYEVKIIVTADENTEDPFKAEVIITERGKRGQIRLPIFNNRDRDPIIIDGKDPSDPGEEYNPSTGAPETAIIKK